MGRGPSRGPGEANIAWPSRRLCGVSATARKSRRKVVASWSWDARRQVSTLVQDVCRSVVDESPCAACGMVGAMPSRCHDARARRRPTGARPPVGYSVGRCAQPARRSARSHEAHLPAQEAQARPHPRLPRTDEHSRWPDRAEAPPRQGPQAAHGLVAGRPSGGRSPKRRRLSRSAEFERVYRQGRAKSNRFLVLYAFARDRERDDATADGPRLGLSVSRRVGGAVDRTRVKRFLREAFWAEIERLPEGSDYVVVARPDARELAEGEGMPGVRSALRELVGALTGADGTGRERTTAADHAGGATAADPGRGSG